MEGKRIRCNHCMSEFDEENIDVDALGPNSGETCPVCNKGDALMDLEAKPDTESKEEQAETWRRLHAEGQITDARLAAELERLE